NILGPFPPERGVTTDPRVISAIVKELKRYSPKDIIVGDNSGSIHFDPFKIARITGILDASDGCYSNIEKIKIEIIAKIDDKETYLVVIRTTPHIITAKIDIVGLRANTTPNVVAMPLPPLNPRNKDQS
ncbi:unnamed protein product, partial [marine sediment metagenome]